jgi:prepilin-type N-terminal cleavage/methylation domain-containing protein
MQTSKVYQSKNQTGFTLVEVLLVLSLIGLVLAGVFQFFFFTHKSYAYADARSQVIQDINLFFTRLEKDIRSASEPNDATKAIQVLNNGDQMDIYRFNKTTNRYERISYRLNGNQIQRGLVSTDTQDTTPNPQYAAIPDSAWETIVTNLLPGSSGIFKDDRNDPISSRRLIDVSISVKHPNLNQSISMNTAIMSRTGKSTTSIIASNDSYVEVTSVRIDPNLIDAPRAGLINQLVTATVEPANATNKNLYWEQRLGSIAWVDFPEYSFVYDDGTADLLDNLDVNFNMYSDRLTTRSGQQVKIEIKEYKWYELIIPWYGNPRTAVIRVKSPDGPSATLTINQQY